MNLAVELRVLERALRQRALLHGCTVAMLRQRFIVRALWCVLLLAVYVRLGQRLYELGPLLPFGRPNPFDELLAGVCAALSSLLAALVHLIGGAALGLSALFREDALRRVSHFGLPFDCYPRVVPTFAGSMPLPWIGERSLLTAMGWTCLALLGTHLSFRRSRCPSGAEAVCER